MPIEQESQVLYNYLLQCANTQSPQTVVDEFQSLFIQGKNEDSEVSKALNKILISTISQKQFAHFFNHCFYLIFNCWVAKPEALSAIPELLTTIDIVSQSSSYDRRRKQLIKLIQEYQKSPAYTELTAIINILDPLQTIDNENIELIKSEISNGISNQAENDYTIINNHLARYPFLYPYFYPQHPELEQLRTYISSLGNSRQQNFEIKLSRHILYRFRLQQVAKINLLSKGAGKVITKVNNPSLLSEKAFRVALKQYIAKINKQYTLLERSQRFIADNQNRNSYQIFKQDLQRFLSKNIKSRNTNYKFDQILQQKLEQTFPKSDHKPLNNTLILQTCRQLFSFLIIESNSQQDIHKIADLIANLGTAQVMLLLIKLTLICPESQSDLTKKIALIVKYHQLDNIQDFPWLVKALEHLLIALGIYFGKIDVSIAKSNMDYS